MKRRVLWVGGAVLVVGATAVLIAVKGCEQKPLVVQTAEGRPVVGARVFRCEPVKPRHQAEFERRKRVEPKLTWDDYRRRLVHTDTDGRWEGRFLPPRPFELLIRAEGFRDREIQIELGPQQEINRTLVLERGPSHTR